MGTKGRSLQELKARSQPARDNPELVEIAAGSSPTASFNLALAKTGDMGLAKACRWLATIRRDFGEKVFRKWVGTPTE